MSRLTEEEIKARKQQIEDMQRRGVRKKDIASALGVTRQALWRFMAREGMVEFPQKHWTEEDRRRIT